MQHLIAEFPQRFGVDECGPRNGIQQQSGSKQGPRSSERAVEVLTGGRRGRGHKFVHCGLLGRDVSHRLGNQALNKMDPAGRVIR